ncbi:MAG: pre-peptidase C-terminal domain-containing protein [Cyanobacteriota bacterium]|nr:pre-peptidase C-terminal domain-containing protein [Cyanobacteriota bacterium]
MTNSFAPPSLTPSLLPDLSGGIGETEPSPSLLAASVLPSPLAPLPPTFPALPGGIASASPDPVDSQSAPGADPLTGLGEEGPFLLPSVDPDDFSDDTSTTGSLPIGGSRTGVVDFDGDRDWFRLSLTAGRTYRFTLDGLSLTDPTLALLNASGDQLGFNDDFSGRNSQITFTATASGTFFLDAGAFTSGTGSYLLLAEDIDDFSDDTSTAGSINVGGSRTGVVDFDGDRDWFRLSLTAGRTYRFNLDGTSLSDPTLALLNASGSQLAFNDDFSGRNSQITFTATASGIYFLDAGAFNDGTGSYHLQAADTTPSDDFADDSSTTGSLAVGGSRSGVVNFDGDQDWFRLSLTAGRTYRFNLDGTTLTDPTLALLNASGNQLAFNDDFSGRNSQITFTATASGTYFLDAGSYNSGTGSYLLQAADSTPTDDFADDSSTTGSLAVGGSRSGVVNFDGDRDWFRITLIGGQTYRFNLNGTTLSDPTLALRNASGSQLAFNDDFSGRNSQITFTASSTGTYVLDAGAYSSGTGSYTLLAANTTPVRTTDDVAGNASTSARITVGGSRTGVVNFHGDRDWFRIALTAGRTYRFNLNGATLSDPTLALLNPSGSRLAFNDDFSGRNSQITFTASSTGTYVLDAGAFSNGTGSYTLLATDTTPVRTTDDVAGNASTTARISVGGSRTGAVNFNADRDWFRISLSAGRTYMFTAVGSSLRDPNLFLRDANGNQRGFAEDTGGSLNPVLLFAPETSGSFLLDVGAKNNVGAGGYTLYATDLLANDDFSADLQTRGSVAIGGSRTGAVNFNNDRDWFRITLTAGQTYRFNLNGNSLTDPTLTLRNANGDQIAFNDDFNGRNPQITFTATASGTYVLDAGAYSSGTGTYTLLAASTSTISDDYLADPTTTGSVVVGREASGTINFSGDHDWFRLALTAGQTYRINLDGTTLSDPTLTLRDSSGRNILASNDNFSQSLGSQITYAATTTGTYFLDAAATGSLTGSYSLRATNISSNSDRIAGVTTPGIRNFVNTALQDNLFSHGELASLLRTTGTNGVTFQELSDLRTVSNQLNPYLSATARTYHQYIYNAVVNGNTANQWWTGGGSARISLGNLTAGSTQAQMNRLVDKWFGGLDLPTNFVTGDSAAAANSVSFSYRRMTGNLFVNDISFSDINQGRAGTCYFLAACASLANNQRQLIRDMFRDNGDGTYGVRFYGSTGNELWVTVDRSAPVISGSLVLAGNDSRSLGGEMWVALAEKAYAQANEIGAFNRATQANSYRYIEGGRDDVLQHLVNRRPQTYSSFYSSSGWTSASGSLSAWNTYLNSAVAALNAGKSLWVLSLDNTTVSGKSNFVAYHVFAITGYNARTGLFTLSNPWGAGSSTFAGVFQASWQNIFNVQGIVAWV